MNWEIVGATGDWAGAIVVVATLFYLARQIKLNARQLERQIGAELGTRVFQSYDPIYEGRNAEIMWQGLQDNTDLSDADRYVFNLLMHRQHGAMLELCGGIATGEISKDEIKRYRTHYQEALLRYPGARKWFLSNKNSTEETVALLGLDVELRND